MKELTENPIATSLLKSFVKDRYCVPEGMSLVMISNGKIARLIDQIIEKNFLDSIRVMQQRVERLFCLMKRR